MRLEGRHFIRNKKVWKVGPPITGTHTFNCRSADGTDCGIVASGPIKLTLINYERLSVGTVLEFNEEAYIIMHQDKLGHYHCSREDGGPPESDIIVESGHIEIGMVNILEIPTSVPKWNEQKSVCSHKNKYKNILSNTLKFWYCPDCKKDLGDA
jgi:hypothetical protein